MTETLVEIGTIEIIEDITHLDFEKSCDRIGGCGNKGEFPFILKHLQDPGGCKWEGWIGVLCYKCCETVKWKLKVGNGSGHCRGCQAPATMRMI